MNINHLVCLLTNLRSDFEYACHPSFKGMTSSYRRLPKTKIPLELLSYAASLLGISTHDLNRYDVEVRWFEKGDYVLPDQIVALAERCRSLFNDYPSGSRQGFAPFDPDRDSEYEDDDRYHVLPKGKMPLQLAEAICASFPGLESRVKTSYFQIQRYDRG